MELDELKKYWDAQERKLEAGLRLNRRLLDTTALAKAEAALGRLSRLLGLELLMNLAAAFFVGSFLAAHVSEARFLIPAAALQICVIAVFIVAIRQMMAIRTLGWDTPIVVMQRRLESLRVERIRAVKWTLLMAPLLWTPLLIVALKGLLGVDAYATLGVAYLIANLVFGSLVIVLGVWISKRYADRMAGSPLLQRLMRDLAGASLTSAAAFLASIERFQEEEGRS